MYIVDMHCDSLSCVSGERGLINSYNVSHKYPYLQFCAHFSEKGNDAPEERVKRLLSALNVYLYETDRLGLARVIDGRDVFSAVDGCKAASVFTIEGGGGLFADSKELDTVARAGLAVMGMAWDNNELSSCAWDDVDNGLTEQGVKMVKRCSELGIILDVSHLSDRAFYEVFELSPLPHIATHSNFRDVCDSRRNLTLDMACKIAGRGGVIGINIYPPFLNSSGKAGMDDILRHIDYGLEHVGEDAIGFGFDIDGTEGLYPAGLDESESIHDRVVDMLLAKYPQTIVEKIAGGNVIEFLKNNLM
jgi:membrane dipeptidase